MNETTTICTMWPYGCRCSRGVTSDRYHIGWRIDWKCCREIVKDTTRSVESRKRWMMFWLYYYYTRIYCQLLKYSVVNHSTRRRQWWWCGGTASVVLVVAMGQVVVAVVQWRRRRRRLPHATVLYHLARWWPWRWVQREEWWQPPNRTRNQYHHQHHHQHHDSYIMDDRCHPGRGAGVTILRMRHWIWISIRTWESPKSIYLDTMITGLSLRIWYKK